jgi:hypothetical protein
MTVNRRIQMEDRSYSLIHKPVGAGVNTKTSHKNLLPPSVPHALPWDRARTAAVGTRRLTA